jgi:hypothetical protein
MDLEEMGITDTSMMNICLMVKWIWRLVTREKGLWADLLISKYLTNKDFPVDPHRPRS